ncbi:MAG TPA: DUF952 domain-containing protein [Myxococcota bacterium]|nr:DUF952 domain-containing protein [Myxococcota bacterium]
MARIYHLVTAPELLSGLAANHYTPARFAEDGFVHCCADEASALAVARDYFAAAADPLLVLALDTARLDAACVFEAPAPLPGAGRAHLATAEKFPHVHGPLALRALRGVGTLGRRGRDFAWPAALGSLGESLAGALAERLRAPEHAGLAGLRRLRRETSRRLVRAPGRLVLELGQSLVATGGMRERVLGSELVLHHPEALGKLRVRDAKRLAGKLASWADVDVFACAIAGQAFRDGRIPEAEILRWARSRDPFWRRAALVSTVPLNVRAQGGAGDARRTLRICRALLGDRADLVVKALSWALRALAERDPAAVERFVGAQRAKLAARVLREVGTKLRTGRKN